ncbi:conjugated polyketone reductase C1 [Crucibulum laeve]|uniref:Conjugated polyketone reductase C1 n=1 Tax=Crucibulum laeve TaxID=68775 RepID=A0A5C3LM81_9AGAR|nr:conjugated polyketone reductase C1 [Crucibulum laeve]
MYSIDLLDGTSIPWLGWGNGSGDASKTAIESGTRALHAGIHHIDTAQLYKNEAETGEAIKKVGLKREDVYVTSKISTDDDGNPVPLDSVRSSVEGSLQRLGFVPDLYLIHNPFVAASGELKGLWSALEQLKSEGKLKSIGVSNFRPQDLEAILDGAKYKPVVNQLEYHPYVLSHLEPVLSLQAKHGIVTEAFGPLTPVIRHPTGGPLKPVLDRIAQRLSKSTGKKIDVAAVLLLWTRAQNVVAVTTSGNPDRIKWLGEVAHLPDLLEQSEIDEITKIGKGVHFRHYTEHMEKDFPLPNLPDGVDKS